MEPVNLNVSKYHQLCLWKWLNFRFAFGLCWLLNHDKHLNNTYATHNNDLNPDYPSLIAFFFSLDGYLATILDKIPYCCLDELGERFSQSQI